MTQTGIMNESRTSDGRDSTPRPTPKVLTSTETRRSFITSEFWIAIAMAAALVIVGYADDNGLGVNRGWELAAGIIGIYILSRGIAKAGSRDPQVRDLDDYR